MKRSRRTPALALVLATALVAAAAFAQEGPPGASVEAAASQVRSVAQNTTGPADWLGVRESIRILGRSRPSEAKELLTNLLRREEPLELEPGAPLPDVMPPLEMLKADAIAALVRIGARDSVPQIERIRDCTEYPVLQKIASEAVAALGGEPGKEGAQEPKSP